MSNNTIAELRGFSATNYVQSAPNVMGGGASFAAQVITRQLAPKTSDSAALLAGNLNGATGWAFFRLADTNDGSTMNFLCLVVEGAAAQTLSVSFAAAYARFTSFILNYRQGVEGGNGTLELFSNGVLVGSQTTSTAAMSASSGRFSIGYLINETAAAAPESSVIGYTFGTAITAEEAAANTLEIVKRETAADVGFSTPRTYVYSVQRDGGQGGCPSRLINYGSAGPTAGVLTVVGASIAMLGTPPFEFSGFEAPSDFPTPTPSPTLTALDIYVAATGDDTNDGLTPETPVLTVAGAQSKITSNWYGAAIRIHFGAFSGFSTLTWSAMMDLVASNVDAQIMFLGDGAGQPGEDGFVVVTTGAAGGGSTDSSIVFAGVADAYLGLTIEITSGAASGQRRTIRNNTTAAIVPVAAFSGVSPGDTFKIIGPACGVDLNGADIELVAGANCNYPSIVNFYFTSGAAASVRAESVSCLKLYGCFFTSDTFLSVNNSQVYCGMTTSSDAQAFQDDIHFAQFAAAIAASPVSFGDATKWFGWGISSPDSHISYNTALPFNTVTGFLVSPGALFTTGKMGLSLYGGLLGGLSSTTEGRTDIRHGSIPAVLRSGADTTYALDLSATDLLVDGGDASLIFDLSGGESKGVRLLNGSNGAWVGSWTLDANDGICVDVENAQLDINLLNGDQLLFNLSANAVGFVVTPGAAVTIHGGPSLEIVAVTITSDGTGGFGVLNTGGTLSCSSTIAFQGTLKDLNAVTVGGGGLSLLTGTITMDQVSNIFTAAAGGRIVLSEMTFTNAASGMIAVADGSIVGSSVSGTCDAPGFVIVASGSIVAPGGELTFAAGSSPFPGLICQVNARAALLGGPYTSEGLGVPAFYVNSGSGLAVSGDITADGSCIAVDTNSTVSVANSSIWSSANATAVSVTTGSAISFFAGINITSATNNGVDATGGGRVYFNDGTAVTITAAAGAEVVVGPGVLEQSTYALALPNPGDSFSNAGAGASMTRNS